MDNQYANLTIGFIGGGNMSTAIVKGILKHGTHPASRIMVSGPHPEKLQHWKACGIRVTDKNGELFCGCDVIFLGVKPNMLTQAIEDSVKTTPSFPCKNVILVSMLAGVTISNLKEAFKDFPSNEKVIRIMPNIPMSIGAGTCLYTPEDTVTDQELMIVEDLLGKCGYCEKVEESSIDAMGVLTACGPAFMYVIMEGLADGAVKQGVPRATALRLAAQMVNSSAQMVIQTNRHPGSLKDDICSPGGSTICGIAALEDGNIRSTMIKAVEAATLKTKEFAKKK